MDEDLLRQMIQNFSSQVGQFEPQEDYENFFWQYLNSVNQGATPEDLTAMASVVPEQRRSAMLPFAGDMNFETHPFIAEHRAGLNRLLRRLAE